MARIETYVEDNQVTENDIVIGSDGDNINKTKNFRVSALANFIPTIVQDNIPKIVSTTVTVDETIESKLSSINLTVSETDSPVLLVFLKDQEVEGSLQRVVRKYVYLFPLGNGTYNPISSFIDFNDLVLLNIGNPTQSDVDSLDNTTIIDLGDVTGSDFITEINNQNPSYDLSDSEQTYFFSYEDSGSLFLQKFVGTNGLYGLNDNQAVPSDFISFSDTSFDDDNVKAKFVEVVLNSTSFASESLEVNDFVREFNLLSPNVTITDKELIVGYSDTLENDVGTNYRSVYIVNTGKGTYGDGATQISSANVIKVRGDVINENLSSYNNDASLATETYVDDEVDLKVDKSGDTMTGTLVMGSNKVTSTATPSANEDLTNKAYVDSLYRYRGDYTSSATIIALTSNTTGDYATLSDGDVNQLWVYQNSAWKLLSAKPYVLDISSNTTLSNKHHNATINVTTGNITLNLPDGLIDGLEFNVRNESGGTLTFNATGTNTTNETSLFTGNLATCILDDTAYIFDKTGDVIGEDILIGLYNYDDNQAAQTLVADTAQTLSNNGAGTNTYKDALPDIPNIYNVGTDRFDFSDLNINDVVKVRIDLTITTASAGEVVDCEMVLGEGQAGEYNLPVFSSKYFKDADTYRIVEEIEIFMGNTLTKDNPALLQITSSGADDVLVNGWYVKVINRN